MPPLPNAPTLKPHYGFMHNVELSFTLAKDTFTLSPDRGTDADAVRKGRYA